jgi:hypothetical protein
MTTGWPPGLLQDDDRKLSRWLASRPDALYQLRKNMTQEIIAMAREAGFNVEQGFLLRITGIDEDLVRFATLVRAAERKKVAAWMITQGYATGHGDTTEDLLEELEREIGFKRAELWIKRISEAVLAEREACAKVCDDKHHTWRWDNEPDSASGPRDCATAIRARGQA